MKQKKMTRAEKEAAGTTKPVQSKFELKRAAQNQVVRPSKAA
jgi:hypothetical protein